MKYPFLDKIKEWIQTHPGLFLCRESGDLLTVREVYSQKSVNLAGTQIRHVEEKVNSLELGESYLGILFETGHQLILAKQGFAFPPDFSNTGPLSLPSEVYCMQDYHSLLDKLKHLAAVEGRQREAVGLIMILIAILDGAGAAGLDVDSEALEVDEILSKIEQGQILPDPHD